MKLPIVSRIAAAVAVAAVGVQSVHGLDIVIDAQPSLLGNPAALDAFNRAAARWESIFTDPVTVVINADVFNFGPGNENIIGSAGSSVVGAPYDFVRAALIADAALSPNGAIVGALPTAAEFGALLPAGFSLWNPLDRYILLTSANAKALGASLSGPDAAIQFNTAFDFDYDNSDGVGAGLMDFETVAIHEIGHALGFVSVVDDVDYYLSYPQDFGGETDQEGNILIDPFTLDLFRFPAGANPSDLSEFTSLFRELRPGSEALFDDLDSEHGFSTGFFNGDGNQASHWKADDLTFQYIGMMDPTLNFGTTQFITTADVRSLDLIGWDVPEASTYAAGGFLALGVAGMWLRRRRA